MHWKNDTKSMHHPTNRCNIKLLRSYSPIRRLVPTYDKQQIQYVEPSATPQTYYHLRVGEWVSESMREFLYNVFEYYRASKRHFLVYECVSI